jgi:hypothetical protein
VFAVVDDDQDCSIADRVTHDGQRVVIWLDVQTQSRRQGVRNEADVADRCEIDEKRTGLVGCRRLSGELAGKTRLADPAGASQCDEPL